VGELAELLIADLSVAFIGGAAFHIGHLAPIPTHKPIGTEAYYEDRQASTYEAAKVVFETHGFFEPRASMRCPIDA